MTYQKTFTFDPKHREFAALIYTWDYSTTYGVELYLVDGLTLNFWLGNKAFRINFS